MPGAQWCFQPNSLFDACKPFILMTLRIKLGDTYIDGSHHDRRLEFYLCLC